MSVSISELHRDVDRRASDLAERHTGRLQCRRGCHDCCLDDLTVLHVEAEAIRMHVGESLRAQSPRDAGSCAFLDAEGACRVYAARPYICRTQGLPLRWFELDEGLGEVSEYRDICPLNLEGGPPLETLHDDDVWTLGQTEEQLLDLNETAPHAGRTPLRELFDELSRA